MLLIEDDNTKITCIYCGKQFGLFTTYIQHLHDSHKEEVNGYGKA